MHFRLDFIMEANAMNPDPGSSLIWVHIVCNIGCRRGSRLTGWKRVKSSNEPQHEISNKVVCVASKGSDQPAHMHSLIRAFASRLDIL